MNPQKMLSLQLYSRSSGGYLCLSHAAEAFLWFFEIIFSGKCEDMIVSALFCHYCITSVMQCPSVLQHCCLSVHLLL